MPRQATTSLQFLYADFDAIAAMPNAPALEKAMLPEENTVVDAVREVMRGRAAGVKLSLKLPLFGMNVEQATSVKWHRQVGDSFKKGDPLYEIEKEKEKVTTEVEAS